MGTLKDLLQKVIGSVNENTENIRRLSGGNSVYVGVEPAEEDIPKVFITGVKPVTKDDVLAEMVYVSKTDSFHAYLNIKCQGTSSMSYPKKNFTVKLYSDEARETALKKDFKDWNHPGNQFVLKANWIDHSHARNIVSARLWNEVVASRSDYDSLPEEMRNSPKNGAVDGFPIKVYYNGAYEGIYTWNIGKDDWMWRMDTSNPNHILLCAEGNTDGVYAETSSNFRALWNGVDGSKPGWSVEVGTNSDAVKNSLNNLIRFVMDNDGDAFRNGIGQYLDIQSAIDYYIFQYEICGLDGLAHNMLLATYDGKLWRCGAYDMDATFGLWWDGTKFVSATFACPEEYQERYSLLWERIEANFQPELKARQAELRKTVLSYSNVVTHFERFMDVIGLDLYAEDLTIYSGIPSGSTNNIKQIRNYIRDRQAYVDSEFAALTEPVPCTGITLNANTLTFTAEGTQTLTATVSPDGCTDAITWESDNTGVATVNGGVVTAIANGSATITAKCGKYSASCSVAVSGIAESVSCTGITLDKTELTFDGEGTQIVTATVVPSNTTDTVVWVSSAPAVASISVEGNICTVRSIMDGDAVITVTCGGQSASCSVSVSGIAADEMCLYRLPNEAVFNGTSDYIDTDVALFTENADFTILCEFTGNNPQGTVFHCVQEAKPWPGVSFDIDGGYYRFYGNARTTIPQSSSDKHRIVMVKNAAAGTIKLNWDSIHNETLNSTTDITTATFGKSLVLGAKKLEDGTVENFWSGTIHDFRVYSRQFTDDEILAYCGRGDVLDVTWSSEPTGKITDTGVVQETGGDAYLSSRLILPDGKTKLCVANVGTGSYIWKEIAIYDSDGAFISKTGDKGKTADTVVDITAAVYAQVTVYPNNVAANNDPANQIVVTCC